jgi:hypothetical protein
MKERRRILWLLIGMVGILIVTLLVTELTSYAHEPGDELVLAVEPVQREIGGGYVPATLVEEPPPPPSLPPEEDDGDGEEGDEDAGSTTPTVVEKHTILRILFPYETLGDAIKETLINIVGEMTLALVSQVQDAINRLGQTLLQKNVMFQNVRRDVWRVSIIIAGILMPLSFMVSIGAALKDGTSSVTGYASAREAIINWVIAAGAAVSSYFLLSKGIELASLTMVAILEGLMGEIISTLNLGDLIIGTWILGGMMLVTPGLGQIFLAFFGMLLAVGLGASIGLAFLAREVILLLVVGIAPITLILGSVGPLRWLNGLWLKITTITLLLGPANALLIGAAALLGLNAHQSGLSGGGIVDRILGYLVALGILSVLIGLNTLIGKMVYGAAIEIANKAMKGITSVLNLAGIAAGLAAAPAIAGMVGGTGAAALAGSTGPTIGGLGTAAEASSKMRLVNAIGQGIATTGLPGTKGFASGLNIGAAADAHQQVKQGIAQATESRELTQKAREQAKTDGKPWEDSDLSMESAMHTAYGEMNDSIQSGGHRATPASTGRSSEDPSTRLEYGMQFTQNMMKVADKRGLDMRAGFRQLGYPGTNVQNAGTGFARVSISQAAFGRGSSYRSPAPWRNLPESFTAVDLDAARQILSTGPATNYSQPPSENLFDRVAETAYQRRIQLNEAPHRIVHDAGRVSDVDRWMKDSYNQLPDHSLAEDLRKGLGL